MITLRYTHPSNGNRTNAQAQNIQNTVTKKVITLSVFASVRLLTGAMTVHTFNIISFMHQSFFIHGPLGAVDIEGLKCRNLMCPGSAVDVLGF